MLSQPVSQVRLTNVALIKFKVAGKKFEIPCYKNKAINWRNGVEKDIDEVLQIHEVFTNVSKGEIVSQNELSKYFPKMTRDDIIKLILDKGELQVSDKEREVQQETIFKDICNYIAGIAVHPESRRPFALDSITTAIKEIHFHIQMDQPAKKQALLCFKQLKRKYYIDRAQMKIEVFCETKDKDQLEDILKGLNIINYEKKVNTKLDQYSIQALIEPAQYRKFNEQIKSNIPSSSIDIVEASVVNREVQNINEASAVNLQVRSDYNEGDELISSSSDDELQNEKPKKQDKSKQKVSRTQKKKEKKEKEDKRWEELYKQYDIITKQNEEGSQIVQGEEQKEEEQTKTQTQKKKQGQKVQQKEKEEKFVSNADYKKILKDSGIDLDEDDHEEKRGGKKHIGKKLIQKTELSPEKTQKSEKEKTTKIQKGKKEDKKKQEQVESQQKEQVEDNSNQVQYQKLGINQSRCTTCKGMVFESKEEFRNHFKTEFHNYNLKRKVEKLPPLDENEYKLYLFDQEFNKKQ